MDSRASDRTSKAVVEAQQERPELKIIEKIAEANDAFEDTKDRMEGL